MQPACRACWLQFTFRLVQVQTCTVQTCTRRTARSSCSRELLLKANFARGNLGLRGSFAQGNAARHLDRRCGRGKWSWTKRDYAALNIIVASPRASISATSRRFPLTAALAAWSIGGGYRSNGLAERF